MKEKNQERKFIEHFLFGEGLTLLSEKCIFMKKRGILLLADLHFGKSGHFRKAGIPVPQHLHLVDLEKLQTCIQLFSPKKIIVLGDFFHSSANYEWEIITAWFEKNKEVKFELVIGNHDLHSKDNFPKRLMVHPSGILKIDRLLLTHEPMDYHKIPEGHFNLCGHLHPSVTLTGKGRQKIQLPCFYFGEKRGVLPAFGVFTGSVNIGIKPGDIVFAITENSVFKIS